MGRQLCLDHISEQSLQCGGLGPEWLESASESIPKMGILAESPRLTQANQDARPISLGSHPTESARSGEIIS